MAEVTGTIGNEQVELNNAATEATLRLLYQATLNASKQSHDNVAKMVQKAGLDPVAVKAADEGLKKVSSSGADAAANFKKLNPLIGQLLSGTATASAAFATFKDMPGTLGVVMSAFSKVAAYQEANMKVYQQITTAGANLGGSLTDLRQSALNTYMTLDQFGSLIKNNSEAFSRMGGTVNDGAKAFVQLSKSMIGSDIGTGLMALGFTTEQLNNGMASYIAATGGRNRQEMQDRDTLTKSAKAYFEQLDALSTITGTQREEQEKAMKEAAANQAWQAHLLTLDTASRAKAEAARAESFARGGKGAEQALMSAAMGFPPMTKAAQQWTAIATNGNSANMKLVDDIKNSSKSVKDVQKTGADITAGLAKDGKDNSQVFKALVMQGGENAQIAGQALGAANKAQVQGIKNSTDSRAQLEQVQEEQRKRQADSQAAQMVKTEKALKDMGQAINDLLGPAISYVTKIISALAQGLSFVVKGFTDLELGTKALVVGLAAVLLWKTKELIAEKAKVAAIGAKDALSKVKGLVPGSTPANPLYVMIVGRTKGGVGIPEVPEKSGGKGGSEKPGGKGGTEKPGGKMGKLGKLGGLGGLAGGLALDYAGDKLTESGHERWGAGASAASAAVTGASMGAMLGPLGAIAGGLAGGAYGLYQNWDTLAGKTPTKMALGGIVNKPTMVEAGEAGPEVISPLKNFESLQTELQTLNKVSADILKYLKETAENTKRNVDATKSLNGDLFSF